MALINNRTVLSDATGGGTTPSNAPIDWGGIINTGIGALSDVYDNYINAQMQAAGMANAASAAAQQNQFAYNMQAMGQQIAANTAIMREAMSYNAQSAKEANELQYLMQKEAMEYNRTEAEKQRSWQTQMSATAYQRAVEDMRKAGINPILAATNGGANVGSGASASISSSKAAQASGVSGLSVGMPSVGNYTGQGYHLSDTFATFGAILGTVGNVLSALQASGGMTNAVNTVRDALNYADKKVTEKRQNYIRDTKEPYYTNVKSQNYYYTKEYAKEHGLPSIKA